MNLTFVHFFSEKPTSKSTGKVYAVYVHFGYSSQLRKEVRMPSLAFFWMGPCNQFLKCFWTGSFP